MKKTVTLLTGLLMATALGAYQAAAQAPSNDQCSSAQAIQANGPIASGTTVNANDDLIGLVGCQSGVPTADHPDVWFSFTATAPLLDYTVSGPGALEVSVFDGACGGGLLLMRSDCGTGLVTGRVNGLVAGTTYRMVVAAPSPQATSAFTIQVTTTNPPILPSQDCNQATILTSGVTFAQGTVNQGSGAVANEVTTSNSCFGALSGSNTVERQSKWFKFVAGSNGKLLFNINPVTFQDDYDWAVWDVTGDPTGCSTKGNALACNWSGSDGATGLSLCPSQEPGYQSGADTFDNTTTGNTGASAPINLIAGHVYALLVDNYLQTNDGFALSFGGACNPLPGGQTAAQIGLDAAFTFTSSGCNVIAFQKRTSLNVSTAVSYFWNFGDGATSTQANPTHTYRPTPGGTTYTATLQITDVFGNRVASSQQITVTPAFVLALQSSSPAPVCAGQPVTLSVRGGTTYVWSPATGLSSTTDSTVIATPTTTTLYTVRATRGACSTVDTIRVRVAPPVTVTLQSSAAAPVCGGQPVTLTARGGRSYVWSPPTGLSNTTDSTVVATPASTTTYTVTATNGPCTDVDTITVRVVAPFAVRLAATSTSLCVGESATLRARGGQTFTWSPATGLSSATDSVVTAAPTTTTTYTVTATDGPCTSVDTITVRVTPLPTTQAVATNPNICAGSSTTLTASGADRYEWSPTTGLNDLTSATPTASPLTTTTYTVIGYRGQCGVQATVTVNVTPTQIATAIVTDSSGVPPYTISLRAAVPDATAWLWTLGDGTTSTEANPVVTYKTPGAFEVKLKATYGAANCETPARRIVQVKVLEPKIYNVITPNNDGLNDTFSAAVSGLPVSLKVFNRWGRLVHEAANYQQNWDGGDLPAGTYYYLVQDTGGSTWKGWVELVR